MTFTDIDMLSKDTKRRMQGALNSLQQDLNGLRTGRAHAGLFDPIVVDAYGSSMPLNQVGAVNVLDARMLSIQVWDKSLVTSVEKAIRNSALGLNPMAEGQVVRIPVPPLTEERRVELTKVARKYTEEARIAIRNIRRHAIDSLKAAEKNSHISQDELHTHSDTIQDLTDQFIKELDLLLASKEEEIMHV